MLFMTLIMLRSYDLLVQFQQLGRLNQSWSSAMKGPRMLIMLFPCLQVTVLVRLGALVPGTSRCVVPVMKAGN